MTTLAAPPPTQASPRWKWTRELFYRALDAGIIGEDEKVELIGGELITEGMADRLAQTPQHAVAGGLCVDALAKLASPHGHARVQQPLALGKDSDPIPDIALVGGSIRDYTDHHPSAALLVVEIAETTAHFDRTVKASLYASAAIPEYWIVNLPERVAEVHREPVPDDAQPFGFRYGTILRLGPDRAIIPVSTPDREVAVSSLLP